MQRYNKFVKLNIGLNNLPKEDTLLSEIMESVGYSFDVKTMAWAHVWSSYNDEAEPTLALSFAIGPIPDSTIIRTIENLATTYNQDSIAYTIASDNETGQHIEPYLEGLAWNPRVMDGHNKYRFDPRLFVTPSSQVNFRYFDNTNLPGASRHRVKAD